ncbi:MAG: chemotaxis protein CheW [Cyanobacteria bacterium J06598_1]
MKEQTYLTFLLDHRRYSIDSEYLDEMLPLPEITLLPTGSQDIVGVLNVRGDIIPIIDLNLSLGYEPMPYRTANSVIILKQDPLRVGLIVSSIGELAAHMTLEVDDLDPRLQAQRSQARRKQMLTGSMLSTDTAGAAEDDNLCWLLSPPEQWLRYVEIQQLISVAGVLEDNPAIAAELPAGSQSTVFCPTATPEERTIFQQRSHNLRQSLKSTEPEALSTLAIIAIGDHHFGVDLSAVKEFTDIQSVTPIPCCPSHVVGNMNLRGEILTLMDIQSCLNLSAAAGSAAIDSAAIDSADVDNPTTPSQSATPLTRAKVMVIEIDKYFTGIVVQDVLEAMFPLRLQDTMPPSSQLASIDRRYLQGEFSYRNTTIGILDFPTILTQGNLSVDEVV